MKDDEACTDQRDADDHKTAAENQRQTVAGSPEPDQRDGSEGKREKACRDLDFAIHPGVEDEAEVPRPGRERENADRSKAGKACQPARSKPRAHTIQDISPRSHLPPPPEIRLSSSGMPTVRNWPPVLRIAQLAPSVVGQAQDDPSANRVLKCRCVCCA